MRPLRCIEPIGINVARFVKEWWRQVFEGKQMPDCMPDADKDYRRENPFEDQAITQFREGLHSLSAFARKTKRFKMIKLSAETKTIARSPAK